MEITPVETPGQGTQVKTYTMSVVAGKGETGTKALALEGSTLNATWKAGEQVTVINATQEGTEIGTLTAQGDGPSTTLKGTVSDPVANGDQLLLKFLSPDYTSQDGTLTGSDNSIDKVCDYATATVKAIVDGDNITIDGSATFTNQQAIVKFTLKNKNGSSISLPLTALRIVAGETTLNITPNSSRPKNDEIFVAIPAINDGDIFLSATLYDDYDLKRAYHKGGVTLRQGQYYEIGVKLSPTAYVSNYAELQYAVERYDGDEFNYIILAADIEYWGEYEPTISGDRVIDLNGHSIDGKGMTRLFTVPPGQTLSIVGNGTLTGGDASKCYNSSELGENGGAIYNAGTLIINNGVTISGNTAPAGNGGGIYNDGTLTIYGGTITGNTAEKGAGIYQNGVLEVSGGPVVSNNTGDNVYLTSEKVITVSEALNDNASIGVTRADGLGAFTSGYSTFNDSSDESETLFSPDDDYFYIIAWKNGEACLAPWYNVTLEKPYANLQVLLDETGLLSSLGSIGQSIVEYNFPDRNNPASAINYTYHSIDPDGKPVELSACIYIPDAAFEGSALAGICLTNHGTIASNAQCPTNSAQFEGAFAWKNYAIVMPDYYGFGASYLRPQGYLDAENTAHNNIDAYLAAVQLMEDRKATMPDNLFSFGYSQGGFNSMANLKYVSKHPELGISFDKVFCGGSPFDVMETWNAYTNGTFRNSLAFVPMTIVSINETHKLGILYSDLFKGTLLTNYNDWILSKQYTTTEISELISPDPDNPAAISDILHADIVNGTGSAFNAIKSVCESYSLISGWTPPSGTEIFLYHSKQDDTVPYVNLTSMKTFLDEVAPGCYTARDGNNGGHMNAVIWFVINFIDEL